eukprot:1757830-Heterocapsa_arctica.AAC.1
MAEELRESTGIIHPIKIAATGIRHIDGVSKAIGDNVLVPIVDAPPKVKTRRGDNVWHSPSVREKQTFGAPDGVNKPSCSGRAG